MITTYSRKSATRSPNSSNTLRWANTWLENPIVHQPGAQITEPSSAFVQAPLAQISESLPAIVQHPAAQFGFVNGLPLVVIDVEMLKAAIRAKLTEMITVNATRADYAEKFEELIESYNNRSRTIEDQFRELTALTASLNVEQQCQMRVNMSEEALVIFDVLSMYFRCAAEARSGRPPSLAQRSAVSVKPPPPSPVFGSVPA